MAPHSLAGRSLTLEDFTARVGMDGVVTLSGALRLRSPSEHLTPFFQKLHDLAVSSRLSEVRVDVRDLHHVNSSSMFAFVDWARWIAALPPEQRYVLWFQLRPGVAWQQLMLPTMQSICGGHLRVASG